MTREERRKAIRRYIKKNPDVASMVLKALGAYDDKEKCILTDKGKWLKRDKERDTFIRYITANKYGVSEDSELAKARIIFCDGYVSGYIDGECSADSLYTEVSAQSADVITPCDACAYGVPSSGDGKPCIVCPARAKNLE